jgi:hypothetical protein
MDSVAYSIPVNNQPLSQIFRKSKSTLAVMTRSYGRDLTSLPMLFYYKTEKYKQHK